MSFGEQDTPHERYLLTLAEMQPRHRDDDYGWELLYRLSERWAVAAALVVVVLLAVAR